MAKWTAGFCPLRSWPCATLLRTLGAPSPGALPLDIPRRHSCTRMGSSVLPGATGRPGTVVHKGQGYCFALAAGNPNADLTDYIYIIYTYTDISSPSTTNALSSPPIVSPQAQPLFSCYLLFRWFSSLINLFVMYAAMHPVLFLLLKINL